jgi:hydroxyacylglutathione hydrolase
MIIKIFTSGPIDTHAYLIGCPATREAAIIDAPAGVMQGILNAVEHEQLTVKMILITHSHWDHIADAAKLKEKLGIPLYIHALDRENLKKPGSDGLPLFFPVDGVEADHGIKQGDKLEVGHLQLEVIETPGHTPGGVCFWIVKEKVLFSGDTLFQGSMGRVDFPMSNPQFMWESLKKLAKLPPDTKVYPGHGAPTTVAAEAWMASAQSIFGGENE